MCAFVINTIGKAILFGEHAVVYGYPAIAIPISSLKTTVTIFPTIEESQETIIYESPALGIFERIENLPAQHVLNQALRLFRQDYGIKKFPSFRLRIDSQIPIAAGLGSSASISVGIIKALAQFLDVKLSLQKINDYAFELEKLHHGTPSGIDNTVIGFEKTIFFTKGKEPEPLHSPLPFHFLLINSTIPSLTAVSVMALRKNKENNPAQINALLEEIGTIVFLAKEAFQNGNAVAIGKLMLQNQAILQKLDMSLPELDSMIKLALENGALGAKLSGGGRGGNVIALVKEENAEQVHNAFLEHGYKEIVDTIIQ